MATVALSTLRSKLQTVLKDATEKKWPASDLDTFINLALVQWTTDLPIGTGTDFTVVSDQHNYDLPDNAVSVSWVYGYFESGSQQEFLPPMMVKPGVWTPLDEPRRYIVAFPTEAEFYLPRLPQGSTFTLYYGAVHAELLQNSDTLDLRMHRWGELAVLYYAAYLSFLPYAANRARLEQWARKADLNVKNPLEEEGQKYLDRYEELMDKHSLPPYWEFVVLGRIS